jgi:hypothetical protein
MSTLQVENLIGPTSGSNANKVIIPSGQTLDASNGFVAPAGSVIQTVVWEIPATSRSTSGNWSVSTTPTIANTYSVAEYAFTKKQSDSHVVCISSGHVDLSNAGGGRPCIVALFEGGSSTLIGSAYRHVRYNNDEPFSYAFSGIDTSSGTSKTYLLKCHSSGGPMHFSRTNGAISGNTTYNVILQEIAQ